MARALVFALIALALVVMLHVFTQSGAPRGFVLLYECVGVAGGIPFALGVGAGVTHHRALTAVLLLSVVLTLWGTSAAAFARILAGCGLGLLAGHATRAAIHEEGTHAGSQREP